MSTSVCVEGLPSSITVQELKDLFSECGPVLSVELASSADGQPLGIATVEMGQIEGAEKAVRILHHVQLGGRTLLVFRSTPERSTGWNEPEST